MTDEDLIAMTDDHEATGFDVVLRGYDRRQVDDYVERVEVALSESDRLHAEDGERLAALEPQVLALQAELAEEKERAAGLPEPASRVVGRLAEMVRLAEEEAEQLVEQAQERAARSQAELTAELDAREAAVAESGALAEQARLQAQRDVEELRARSQQKATATLTAAREEADAVLAQAREHAKAQREQAEQDVSLVHEKGRARAAEREQAAQQRVEELARQRDVIATQLQSLRETLSAAVGPLGVADPPADRP